MNGIIFTNKHSQVNLKISTEMVETIGLVLAVLHFSPTHRICFFLS